MTIFHINLYSWRHWWRQQVTKLVELWNCYISINIAVRTSIKSSNIENAHGYLAGIFKFCCDLKMTANSKSLKSHTQLQFDLSYENIDPNYAKKVFSIFYGDDVIDDVTGWLQSCPLYSCLGEARSRGKLQGQCLANTCEYHNRISRLCMPKKDLKR